MIFPYFDPKIPNHNFHFVWKSIFLTLENFSSALPHTHSPTSSHSTATNEQGSPTGYSAAFLSAKTEPTVAPSLSSLYPQVGVATSSGHSSLAPFGLDAARSHPTASSLNPAQTWPSSTAGWSSSAASGIGGDSWYASQMSAAGVAAHPYSHYTNPYTGSALGAGLHDSFAAQVLNPSIFSSIQNKKQLQNWFFRTSSVLATTSSQAQTIWNVSHVISNKSESSSVTPKPMWGSLWAHCTATSSRKRQSAVSRLSR